MDSRWILEPGDDLGRALLVMIINGRRGGRMVVDGWKLRTLIKDGVFTSHQMPVVLSVAGVGIALRERGLVPIEGTASH